MCREEYEERRNKPLVATFPYCQKRLLSGRVVDAELRCSKCRRALIIQIKYNSVAVFEDRRIRTASGI